MTDFSEEARIASLRRVIATATLELDIDHKGFLQTVKPLMDFMDFAEGLVEDEARHDAHTSPDEDGWFLYDDDFVPKDEWVTLKVDGYVPVNAKWDADHSLWRNISDELMGDGRAGKVWVPTHWRPIVM
jgi:hypothetical protein